MTDRTSLEGNLPTDVRARIDRACDGFEAAWGSNQVPDLSQWLQGFEGEARAALIGELAILDLGYRWAETADDEDQPGQGIGTVAYDRSSAGLSRSSHDRAKLFMEPSVRTVCRFQPAQKSARSS